MKKNLAIAIALLFYLLFSNRGNTEVMEFDLLKKKAIAKQERNIKQYLIELTILQIEEQEKYVRQKIYGPKSYIDELNKVEKALDILIDNCDYSMINSLEVLFAAQKSCTQYTAYYELLSKEVKTNIAKK